MREALLLRVVWGSAVVAAGIAGVRWTRTRWSTGADEPTGFTTAVARYRGPSQADVDDTASVIGDRDPFRLTREPSSVPYAPGREGSAPPQSVSRPAVTLSGIVGPPWVAVLEGVPGRTGSVVAVAGDTVSRPPLSLLVVHRVTRDTVVLLGVDTTWRLPVRTGWQ
jgi:hypothetical protein